MFLGDKINNVTNHRLWPLFKIKGNTTLELEIGRNKTYVFIFLVQFFSGLSSFKKTQLKNCFKGIFSRVFHHHLPLQLTPITHTNP